MNKFILKLFRNLDSSEIKYCHFKSNNNLMPALSGVDDLDLLISDSHKNKFLTVISKMGFRLAQDRGEKDTPFVFHYYGVDPLTGLIVHLHVYFRIVTGGSILKNHRIFLEEMLLNESEKTLPSGVRTPSANAELILFVVRKMLEQPSLIEHYLFLKDQQNIKKEFNWLIKRSDIKKVHLLLSKCLKVPTKLFDECVDALRSETSNVKRILLGLKMEKYIPNLVYNRQLASILRTKKFLSAHIKGRLTISRSNRVLFPGGMLVAFVGSEASGKSTCSSEISRWLMERFDVSLIHMGKPKKNWRTIPFWAVIRCYSAVKKIFHKGNVNPRKNKVDDRNIANNVPNFFVSYLDSIDRKYWINKFWKRVMQGGIVLSDRYPSDRMDGPRITPDSKIRAIFGSFEQVNYKNIPPPDIVFKMISPLKVTLERNSERQTPEPIEFVKRRFDLAKSIEFPYSKVIEIDTTEPLDVTILKIKNHIWSNTENSTIR